MEAMWLARDKDGTIFLHKEKPLKNKHTGLWTSDGAWGFIPKKLFPEVQWEDKEPTTVKLVIDK